MALSEMWVRTTQSGNNAPVTTVSSMSAVQEMVLHRTRFPDQPYVIIFDRRLTEHEVQLINDASERGHVI